MRSIILSCDRFPLRLLGCYGGEWIETPHFDRLACQGVTFDRCFSSRIPSPNPTPRCIDILTRCANGSRPVALFSDRIDAPFSTQVNTVLIDGDSGDALDVRSIELLLAAALEWTEQHANGLAWVDFSLADAPWVPPSEFEVAKEDDDTPIVPEYRPRPGVLNTDLSPHDWERMAHGWVNRIAYLDSLLGGFLAGLEERNGPSDPDLELCFFAEQGEPLGESGHVGPHEDAVLASRTHVPLIMRVPGPTRLRRSSLMVTLDDLATYLSSSGAVQSAEVDFAKIMIGEHDRERWYLPFQIGDTVGIQTHAWKLIRKPEGTLMLFAKPEDFWDANDLALRYPAVCDTLTQCVERLQSGEPGHDEPN